MAVSERVRIRDMEQLLTLVNEAHEIEVDDVVARKRHLLEGLCKLTGSQVAILNLLEVENTPAVAKLVATYDMGWGSEAERRVIADHYAQGLYRIPEYRDPIDHHFLTRLADGNRPFCIQREEILGDYEWENHPAVNVIRKPAGIDQLIEVTHPALGGKYVGGVGVHRPWGSRRYTRRERHIVRLFNLAILWLHNGEARQLVDDTLSHTSLRGPEVGALPPRVRKVLDLLLEGLGEKQVAAQLGLSRHTVHQYVKMLYASLGVGTRGELLARFVRRANP